MAVIKVKTNDDQIFEIKEKIARMSATIKTMIDQLGIGEDATPIYLERICGPIFKIILEWAEHHQDDVPKKEVEVENDAECRAVDISQWDKELFNVDDNTLFEIIAAANFLDIKSLLEMSCGMMAAMMRGKTAEEIRERFHIENDFPEKDDKKEETLLEGN